MNKQRYALAVYLLLAAISIILSLIALNYYQNSNSIQSLLLNISTELAGTVILFFIVNQLFLLDRDEELPKAIKNLTARVNEQFSPLMMSDNVTQLFIDEKFFLNSAESIDVVGYNLVGMIRHLRTIFGEAVRKGVKVRIIVVDRNSTAAEMLCKHSDKPQMISDDMRNVLDFIHDIEQNIKNGPKPKGTFEVRQTSWLPSCAMTIIRYKTDNDGIARITIHPPSFRLPARGRRALMLRKRDYPDDFEYFSAQFEGLWQKDSYPI